MVDASRPDIITRAVPLLAQAEEPCLITVFEVIASFKPFGYLDLSNAAQATRPEFCKRTAATRVLRGDKGEGDTVTDVNSGANIIVGIDVGLELGCELGLPEGCAEG